MIDGLRHNDSDAPDPGAPSGIRWTRKLRLWIFAVLAAGGVIFGIADLFRHQQHRAYYNFALVAIVAILVWRSLRRSPKG
jgi:uncharacterized membrane protein YsdA (DUF1294 family)